MSATIAESCSLSSLIGFAADRGFVGLALDGADIRAAVRSETDTALLGRAAEIAARNNEKIWQERLARRAFEIDPDGPCLSRLHLAAVLAAAGRCDEAEALLAGYQADPHIEFYRRIRGVLYAKQGQTERAMDIFDALPGRTAFHPAPIVLTTAQEMLEQCTTAQMEPLLARLAQEYPAHLHIRGLYLRFALLAGYVEKARELAEVAEDALTTATTFDRRSFTEAVADSLEWPGWINALFDFVRQAIDRDPTHWSLYDRASRAARWTSRDKEFTAIVELILETDTNKAGPLAIACRWHVDESRLDLASKLLDGIRPLSADLFLQSRLYLCLYSRDVEKIDLAFDDCAKCGIAILGPAVAYSIHTYYYNCSPERLRSCLIKLEPFAASVPGNVYFWQIYLRCLIANGEEQRAEASYAALPAGLANAAVLKPFSMFFDAKAGRHDKARKGWTNYIRSTRHLCVNARSSYPRTIRLRYSDAANAVLLFVTLFNAVDYIDAFLAHYRALGVDHFFIIDNGSTDGSFERLQEEADVSLFLNRDSFAKAGFGILWVNHLMQRFGVGHWCFHVDIDELFVFPDWDGARSLRDLLSYCEDNGFACVPAIELDMYPENLDTPADVDPFAASCYFDLDYVVTETELPPYLMVQGGIRQRLTGLPLSMQKTPLVLAASDVRFIECNHSTTHLPVADIRAALLHYKFIGDMRRRVKQAVARGEHFAEAITYRRLDTAVSSIGSGDTLLSQHSCRYDGPGALLRQGLIRSSPQWDVYWMQQSGKKVGGIATVD